MRLTVSEPFTKVKSLLSAGSVDEALFDVLAEVVENNINMGLQGLNIAHRVVLGYWSLHFGMLSWAGGAEDMVYDLSVDHGAVVVVELGLIIGTFVSQLGGLQHRVCGKLTLSHLPSVP